MSRKGKLARLPPLAVLLLFVGLKSGAQLPQKTLSLYELLQAAEVNNLQLKEARAAFDKASNSITVNRAKLLPTLSLESSVGFDYLNPVGSRQPTLSSRTTEEWNSDASLVLRQTLFDGGTSWRNYSLAQIEEERQEYQLKIAREDLALNLVKAFLANARVERRLQSYQKKLKLLETQFGITSRQFRQGLKTRRDYQRLESELERLRIQMTRTQDEKRATARALQELTGVPLNPEAPQELRVQIPAAEELIQKKARFRVTTPLNELQEIPALKSFDLSIEQADIKVAEAHALYWPRFVFELTGSYGADQFIGPASYTWNERDAFKGAAKVGATWTLWDWQATSSAVANARIDKDVEVRRRGQKQLEISTRLSNLENRILTQEQALQVQRRLKNLEDATFRDIDREYREGKANYLDLINSLERSIQSEIEFESEAFEYFASLAELRALKGILYESLQNF